MIYLSNFVLAHEEGEQHMMGHMNQMANGGWGMNNSWFGWLFMISIWALVIIAIIALLKWLINQNKK